MKSYILRWNYKHLKYFNSIQLDPDFTIFIIIGGGGGSFLDPRVAAGLAAGFWARGYTDDSGKLLPRSRFLIFTFRADSPTVWLFSPPLTPSSTLRTLLVAVAAPPHPTSYTHIL